MEDVGIFYGNLVRFTVFCYILNTFGIVRGNLVYFFSFWYFVPQKSGNPARDFSFRCIISQLKEMETSQNAMNRHKVHEQSMNISNGMKHT
jgi:hypothetical protein